MNIAQYLGYVVDIADQIIGLCFSRYKKRLIDSMLENQRFLDPELYFMQIKDGIKHFHGFEFVHNNINLHNIMFDAEDRPVIIDFDSFQRVGKRLGLKAETMC